MFRVLTALLVLLPLFAVQAARQDEPQFLDIGSIQGPGDVSPYVDELVAFRGIVTGSYEDQNSSGVTYHTLFVQDLPGLTDGNPATSDGIAVFLGRRRPSAQIGDQVYVTGKVTEFFGLTEMEDDELDILVEAGGLPLPEPVLLNPPADNQTQAAYMEAYEAMRVGFAGTAVVVGATYGGCGLAVVPPGVTDVPVVRQTAADPIGQIVPVLHTNDADCTGFPDVKTGDTVDGLAGPLIYHFDQFKLVQQATEALIVTAVPHPPIPQPPVLAPNQISVASFNMENYFDAVDDTGTEEEPKPSPAEIEIKQYKLAWQISQILGCPTVLGVIEVEKEGLLVELANLLADTCGFTYDVTHQESADARGIDVALLTDPRQVVVQSSELRQTCTAVDTGIVDDSIACPAGEYPLSSRPSLQVNVTIDGREYTFYINHFKSKRGGELETAPQRLMQAQFLHTLVEEELARNPEARLVVLGDFNDYELSPTMLEMTKDGRLSNVLARVPIEQRYSFVFSGAAQLLDYILVSPILVDAVDSVLVQHVNADFPAALATDPQSPYHATDHDLPLMVLNPSAVTVAATAVPSPTQSEPVAFNGLWLVVAFGGVVILGGTAVFIRRKS